MLPTAPRRALAAGLLALAVTLSSALPGVLGTITAAAGPAAASTVAAEDDAPGVVEGRDGELFYGPYFDQVCRDDAAAFEAQLRQLSRLVRVIRASGRRTLFTVVPDKALVEADQLDVLPHGRCDRRGLRDHARVLDRYADPAYVPLLRTLRDAGRRTFWRTDTHWTTVGAAVHARVLARRLDEGLGARVRYVAGPSQTRLWPMGAALGRPAETAAVVRPRWGMDVEETKGHLDKDGYRTILDHAWRTRPQARAHPGRTLMLGDSFTFLGLNNYRPLFARGRFVWVGPASVERMARGIARADTVVIEVAEFLLPDSVLISDSFRRAVRRAVR